MRKPKKRALSWVLSIVFVLAAFAAPFTAGTSEGDQPCFDLDRPHGEHFCCAEHSGETECDQSCFDLDHPHDGHFCCAEHIAEVEGDEKDDTRYTPPEIDPGCGCLIANAGTYTTDTTSGNVNIRAGHSTQSNKIGSIPRGSTFSVSAASSTWAHVNYNGISGYVSMSVIKKVADAPNPGCDCTPANSGTYTTDTNGGNVNIRAEHSTQSNKIGSIPYGSTFKVSAASNSWAHVNYNGVKGYVSMSVIKRVPNPTPDPTPAPLEFGNIPSTLNPGSSATITVNNYSASELNWTLSNTRVASVNPQTGVVTANACGKITLTVSLIGNSSVSATTTLSVTSPTTETQGITSGCVYMIYNAERDDMCLAVAASGNGVELADCIPMYAIDPKEPIDGRQLWYVEWTDNGYKLYSMGHKDKASDGRYESLLRGCAKNGTPGFGNENSNYLTWSIHKHNGYYYLTNTGKNYKNTSVSAKSSGNTVSCIDLANETSYAGWVFKKIDNDTFNNYWAGGYNTGYQNGKFHIKINLDEASLFGSGEAVTGIRKELFNVLNTKYNQLNNPWNNLSSKIVIYGPDDNDAPNNAFQITYEGDADLQSAGKTQGLTNDNRKLLNNQDWDKVSIYINTSGYFLLVDDNDKVSTILHELGHALKLAHPNDPAGSPVYPGSNSVCSIMNEYSITLPNYLACLYPKKHDIINLRNKWK